MLDWTAVIGGSSTDYDGQGLRLNCGQGLRTAANFERRQTLNDGQGRLSVRGCEAKSNRNPAEDAKRNPIEIQRRMRSEIQSKSSGGCEGLGREGRWRTAECGRKRKDLGGRDDGGCARKVITDNKRDEVVPLQLLFLRFFFFLIEIKYI